MAVCSSCGRKGIYFICRRWFCPFCTYELLGHDAPEMVFVDVETTGVNPHDDSIIQLSAVRYRGGEKVEVLDTYINPLRKIPPAATLVNGITDDMVRFSPKIKDIRPRFMEFIKDSILVGYNVLFDLRFLDLAFRGALIGTLYIDVLPAAKEEFKLPNHKLETVATHLGFHPEDGFHNSLTDCEATAAVYFHLVNDGQLLSVSAFRGTGDDAKSSWAYKKISPSELSPQWGAPDEAHPLYGKNIVFTGELSIEREDAMQIAVDVGAVIKGNVSGKTDFLVVGQQDLTLVGSSGISGKERKAKELNDSRKGHIRILSEQEFMELIQQKTEAGVL